MPAPHSRPSTRPAPGTPDLAAATRAAARTASGGAAPRSGHLSATGISAGAPDRRILTDLTFSAAPGDRIGVIGENGTGKSTLLGILAGRITPTAGELRLPGTATHPARVGLLAQELGVSETTAIGQVLDSAQHTARRVLAELERLGAEIAERPEDPRIAAAFASALAEAERSDAWAADALRGEVVAGLGLGGIPEARPVSSLSGGQRIRLALAAVLLEAPEVLLLDEPSNHLDDASSAYLERVLRAWPGIVIFASHDRSLLDAVATRILDLDPLPRPARELADAVSVEAPPGEPAGGQPGAQPTGGGAPLGALGTERPGSPAPTPPAPESAAPGTDDSGSGYGARLWGVGYSEARAERRAELVRWRERYAAESEELAALRHEIEVGSREVNRKHESKSESRITRKFYADKDARVTARRARNARVRLDALERTRVRRPPEPLRFRGFGSGSPGSESGPVLSARDVAVNERLAPVSLELAPRGRLLLTGPNGAGKSTLLSVLAGRLRPDAGAVERTARVGLLPQEFVFPDPSRTVSEVWRSALGAELGETLAPTASGLVSSRDLDRPLGALSVGQRRRAALALLIADPPPVLILDEPTNHLSLTLVEELEAALREYPGALVLASHDRWLRERWPGDLLALDAPVSRRS